MLRPKCSPEYEARKAALDDGELRQSLDLVEESILLDPNHRYRRPQVGEIVYDTTEHGLMAYYTMDDGEPVMLGFADTFDR
jgi:hypothetical protein